MRHIQAEHCKHHLTASAPRNGCLGSLERSSRSRCGVMPQSCTPHASLLCSGMYSVVFWNLQYGGNRQQHQKQSTKSCQQTCSRAEMFWQARQHSRQRKMLLTKTPMRHNQAHVHAAWSQGHFPHTTSHTATKRSRTMSQDIEVTLMTHQTSLENDGNTSHCTQPVDAGQVSDRLQEEGFRGFEFQGCTFTM